MKEVRHFPGGPAVKNLPRKAEDSGLISGQGIKIPHTTEQLSPRSMAGEPVCHKKDPESHS